MEIPIKNPFISNAIKTNTTNFNPIINANNINNLSQKKKTNIPKKKPLNNKKNNYSTIYKKLHIRKNLLKKTKNLSVLCIKPKKNIMDNLNYTGSGDISNHHIDPKTQILPKLVSNSNIYNNIELLKNKKANSNQNTFTNVKNKFIEMNKKMVNFKTSKSTLNSDRSNNNPYINDKFIISNLKIMNNNKKKNSLKYLYLNQKKNNNNSKKNLLIKINSLNATLFNNIIWKIKNINKLQNYRNKYDNNNINRLEIFKKMKFGNIT